MREAVETRRSAACREQVNPEKAVVVSAALAARSASERGSAIDESRQSFGDEPMPHNKAGSNKNIQSPPQKISAGACHPRTHHKKPNRRKTTIPLDPRRGRGSEPLPPLQQSRAQLSRLGWVYARATSKPLLFSLCMVNSELANLLKYAVAKNLHTQ